MAYNTFRAVLISPDGEDHVTDFRGCKTLQEVWNCVNDMGSRWFFYPIPFVMNERTNKIRGIPDNFPDCFMDMSISEAKKFIQDNPCLNDLY